MNGRAEARPVQAPATGQFTFNFVQIPYADLFTKVLGNLAAGTGAPDLVGIGINALSCYGAPHRAFWHDGAGQQTWNRHILEA